ncbi:hypothetical protein C8Q74DRAFT_1231216 [Fomes fomentarius]|nr:hypothetical protein C8Q74DRAFT_1231216 [Fomes fomentarius]
MERIGPSVQLPLEVWLIVIDYLEKHIETLRTCSLVCRSWVSTTRSRLFRTMEIFPTASSDVLQCFSDFLQSCQDARTYLRDLTLNCVEGAPPSKAPERQSGALLYHVLSSLPALQQLTVIGLSFDKHDLPVQSRLSIRNLDLTGCWFHLHNISSITDVLRLFSSIQHLCIDGFWRAMAPNADVLKDDTEVHTQIRHLKCDSMEPECAACLYDVVQQSGSLNGILQSLHLCWQSWSELVKYSQFIIGTGPRLRSLELEPEEVFWERGMLTCGVRWQDLGLLACTRLESLTLHLRYSWLSYQRCGYADFFKGLDSYARLLSQHAFLPLRQLILKFSVHFGGCTRILECDDQGAWGRLDEALSKLPGLHVTLDIFSLGQLAEVDRQCLERGLRLRLPSPARLGHLRIHFSNRFEAVSPGDC